MYIGPVGIRNKGPENYRGLSSPPPHGSGFGIDRTLEAGTPPPRGLIWWATPTFPPGRLIQRKMPGVKCPKLLDTLPGPLPHRRLLRTTCSRLKGLTTEISTSSSNTATPTPTPSSSSQPIHHPALGLDLGPQSLPLPRRLILRKSASH